MILVSWAVMDLTHSCRMGFIEVYQGWLSRRHVQLSPMPNAPATPSSLSLTLTKFDFAAQAAMIVLRVA